ncbi:MAG: hypothetical protein KJ666_13750 [Bacteroidetes bacterium]|nr:hypothetical protein [Bacteroidota bacterium]MBU2585393.1 hypothetical protein [Bacteroidota bacterium]
MNKFFAISLVFFLSWLYGCEKSEELISPYHYSILPKPSSFKITKADTSSTGIWRVRMSWTMSDTTNLKNFEVFRSIKYSNAFKIIQSTYVSYTFVDSSLPAFTDSVKLFYKVFPIGQKTDIRSGAKISFTGPEADMDSITIKKSK